MTEKSGLEKLREPFAPNQISKLPKPYKKDSPRGNCKECGGYHGLPAVHLDYVGHAALTDRLLDADPLWSWEPLALGADGCPLIDSNGGMWIKLTVCGVTRLGYGDAQGKTGGDAMKERIGDALRNAGMRFGAALDLWHKGDLHADKEDETGEKQDEPEPPKKELLTVPEFNLYKKRIKEQITKKAARVVWQEANKVCAAIGDNESSDKLKEIVLEHDKFIDAAAEKEMAE